MISLRVSLSLKRMQEKWERLKIPPAWKPDKWICHHSGHRQSSMLTNYYYHSWDRKSTATSRNLETPGSTKRISTAKLRRRKLLFQTRYNPLFYTLEIESLSLKSAEYRRSARQSKIKRLNGSFSPKSYKSIFSSISHRPMTPIHIPKMSKQSLKRWLDARDAYLGHNFPFIQDRKKRFRRRHHRNIQSHTKTDNIIDYECAASVLSIDSDRLSIPELKFSGKQRRLSRKDNRRKPISQSETNLRRKIGCFEGIKSLAQSSVRSLSRLSPRKCQTPKRTQIIHDHFDDKCVGTEISERNPHRENIECKDQTTQANIPRPQIKLHHEYDTSMVVGEKKQRIRSVRQDVEYHDKATETDFIITISSGIVEKERRRRGEEEEHQVKNQMNDKATRADIHQENGDSDQNQSHLEQDEHPSASMSKSIDQKKTKKMELQQPSPAAGQIFNNRIGPIADLDRRTHDNGSNTTILTSTESTTSAHEQLLRYANEFELMKISFHHQISSFFLFFL